MVIISKLIGGVGWSWMGYGLFLPHFTIWEQESEEKPLPQKSTNLHLHGFETYSTNLSGVNRSIGAHSYLLKVAPLDKEEKSQGLVLDPYPPIGLSFCYGSLS